MTGQPSPQPDIESQKLSFEREKVVLEESWKKKTFLWSILSTLIGSAVTVVIALISAPAKKESQPPLPPFSSDAVETCRLSLQRLPTLAMQENQTLGNIRDAIGLHVQNCDQLLIDMRTYLARSGR